MLRRCVKIMFFTCLFNWINARSKFVRYLALTSVLNQPRQFISRKKGVSTSVHFLDWLIRFQNILPYISYTEQASEPASNLNRTNNIISYECYSNLLPVLVQYFQMFVWIMTADEHLPAAYFWTYFKLKERFIRRDQRFLAFCMKLSVRRRALHSRESCVANFYFLSRCCASTALHFKENTCQQVVTRLQMYKLFLPYSNLPLQERDFHKIGISFFSGFPKT